jgi:hypothetical protein
MSEDLIGFDTGAFVDRGGPRPLAVVRDALSRAAADLAPADERRTEEVASSLEESAHRLLEAERRAAYAERLAQMHRGRATVEDLPRGGASSRVLLPEVAEAGGGALGEARSGGVSTFEDGAIAI